MGLGAKSRRFQAPSNEFGCRGGAEPQLPSMPLLVLASETLWTSCRMGLVLVLGGSRGRRGLITDIDGGL